MSSLSAFFAVCLLIVLVAPVLFWQIHRAWKAEQAKNETAPDPRWGTDTSLQDACELLWDLDDYEADNHTTNPSGDQL